MNSKYHVFITGVFCVQLYEFDFLVLILVGQVVERFGARRYSGRRADEYGRCFGRGREYIHDVVLKEDDHTLVELFAHRRRELGDKTEAGGGRKAKVVSQYEIDIGKPVQVAEMAQQIEAGEAQYFRGDGQRRAEYEKYRAVQYDGAHRGQLVLGQNFAEKGQIVEAHQ